MLSEPSQGNIRYDILCARLCALVFILPELHVVHLKESEMEIQEDGQAGTNSKMSLLFPDGLGPWSPCTEPYMVIKLINLLTRSVQLSSEGALEHCYNSKQSHHLLKSLQCVKRVSNCK